MAGAHYSPVLTVRYFTFKLEHSLKSIGPLLLFISLLSVNPNAVEQPTQPTTTIIIKTEINVKHTASIYKSKLPLIRYFLIVIFNIIFNAQWKTYKEAVGQWLSSIPKQGPQADIIFTVTNTDYQLPPKKFKHLLEEIYVLTCELKD